MSSPFLWPGAGALALVIAGLGYYRMRNRPRKQSGETSFLESRIQPDSFFGVSGGQRVDTREATASGSPSMGYSLSQLDAIGDVDPVAEADVYLAYGRDLQAEEILKEAMRANPERLAVRTKLLEVYAKRRDTKGFELLATQLFAITQGSGADWDKAQELGRQIDPDNPLYQPGGRPPEVDRDGRRVVVEPLSATTMPQSVLPTSKAFAPTIAPLTVAPDSMSGVALDLDLGDDSQAAPLAMEATQPMASAALPSAAATAVDFDLSAPAPLAPAEPAAAPAPTAAGVSAMDFEPAAPAPDGPAPDAARPATPLADQPGATLDFGDFALTEPPLPAAADAPPDSLADGVDPLERKLELADEFRQIGDTEGARDLLVEVIAKGSGMLKSKAQTMLDKLG